MRTDSTTSDDTPPQEAVSLSLLQQGEPSTPTDLSELRFLLRRRSPDVAGGSTREVELSCDDLSFATNNPLLHDFPPMIMSAMLSDTGVAVADECTEEAHRVPATDGVVGEAAARGNGRWTAAGRGGGRRSGDQQPHADHAGNEAAWGKWVGWEMIIGRICGRS